jgi:succinate dehydrogenase / fumarate reductase cytochrome b subunit
VTQTQQPAPELSPDISVKPIRKRPGRRKPLLVELYQTGVGQKWVMAITGVILMLFILFHALGNLKVYLGPAEFNAYSEGLRDMLVPLLPRTLALWLIRVVLILAFVFHIHAAYSLTRKNQRANVHYESRRDYLAANFASRTMRWTGPIILLFLIWHLADLTWGLHPIAPAGWQRGLAYQNVTESLQRGGVAALYIVANIALAIHLFHGSWSIFQSMGLNNPRFNRARRIFAVSFATFIGVVNVSFPIMALAGVTGVSN